MPIYSPGSDAMVRQVMEAAERWHPELWDAGLMVDVLEARPKTNEEGFPTEAAITHAGSTCWATIRINGPKERGAGRGDCLLTVDAYRWPELSERQQLAILDHELTHLELVVDGAGAVIRDDYKRPKLRARHHDVHFGWFWSVAERHGADSVECEQMGELLRNEQHQVFSSPFMPKSKRKAG